MPSRPKDSLYKLRTEIVRNLEKIGVPVKISSPRSGRSRAIGDRNANDGPHQGGGRHDDHKICHQDDCPFPWSDRHLHAQTAFRGGRQWNAFPPAFIQNGKNVFYDGKGYGCLSQEALYYIGGLLTHGPALLALTNPSTNSYRRLIPGFEAPVNAFFSLGNRSAAVRIPKYANQPDTPVWNSAPPMPPAMSTWRWQQC